MEKLSIQDLDLNNKKILMRVDFNVPLNEDGSIADDSRIKASLPSISYILNHGGTLILMSHLGRPKGKIDPNLSLNPVAKRLSKLLNKNILPVDVTSTNIYGVLYIRTTIFDTMKQIQIES